jgi:hypothetical protein
VFAPLLAVLLLAGVAAATWVSFSEQRAAWNAVALTGYTGSENIPYFRDPRTVERLAELGFSVDARKAGSREIATRLDLSRADFVMPSGVPAAEKIRQDHKTPSPAQPFYSVMAVASWRPIAEILVANGFAEQREGIYWIVHLDRLLEAVEEKTTWAELAANDAYPARKRVLINSTDLRHSNSAAMYAALASYVWHGDVLQSREDAEALSGRIASLFLGQGYTEHSSSGPFEDYLVMGIGKAPLVMVYESQFLEEAVKAGSRIRPDMVLMYPEPTIFTERQYIPLTENGKRLADILTTDPELQAIAVEYGFRTRDPAAFNAFVTEHDLPVPDHFVNVVNAPPYEVMEALIQAVAERYR